MGELGFSWSDTFRAAVGSCLPCLAGTCPTPGGNHGHHRSESSEDSLGNPNDPTRNRVRRARPDELQGLLADPESTDTEAETLSLHSNPGQIRRQARRKKRKVKNIQVFGFNLFGKPQPIHLPGVDGDDDDDPIRRPLRRPGRIATDPSTRTTSTFDSDASPLDPATIDQFSPEELTRLAEERAEEERLAKEERKRKKSERRELKRLAAALAVGVDDSGEFEGFQGSGQGFPPEFYAHEEGFGQFVSAQGLAIAHAPKETPDDDAADLDGVLYTRPPRSSTSNSGGGSDSRSRTSASLSQTSQSFPPRPAAPSMPPSLNYIPSSSLSTASTTKKKSKKSGRSHKSHSSTSQSTSQSPSIASPASASFPSLHHHAPSAAAAAYTQDPHLPTHTERGEEGIWAPTPTELDPSPFAATPPPSSAKSVSDRQLQQQQGQNGGPQATEKQKSQRRTKTAEFPSTGFSRVDGGGRAGDMGAFLARRGE